MLTNITKKTKKDTEVFLNMKKAIKRIVALGTGAAMLGATVLGAMATADLANYPAPFIEDGLYNTAVVVGADASSGDSLGVADVLVGLSKVEGTVASETTATSTSLVGDVWQVGTSSNMLEFTETDSADQEHVMDLSNQLDKSDLPIALADGEIYNDEGATYAQYLTFSDDASELVTYETNDDEVTADFFYVESDAVIAVYEMEFKEAFKSDITDKDGDALSTGAYLRDYEDEQITILGTDYTIVRARTGTSDNSVKLTLMGGSSKQTMDEGETSVVEVNGVKYEVEVDIITDVAPLAVKFIVDGNSLDAMGVGDSKPIKKGSDTDIGITEIWGSEAGDLSLDQVSFYIGSQKLILEETNVTSQEGVELEFKGDTLDNAIVTIDGDQDSTSFQIDGMQITMTASDDFFVPRGGKITDVMDEPEIFLNSWDIEYTGWDEVETEEISIKPSGDDEYKLTFTDANGYEVSLPFVYASDVSKVSLGEPKHALILNQVTNITEDDYFVVANYGQEAGRRDTYALKYVGATKSDDSDPAVTFKDLGSGETITRRYTNNTAAGTADATIKIGGQTYNVFNSSDDTAKDFNITVDLTSTDIDNTLVITTKYGAEIAITDNAETDVTFSIETKDTNDYESLTPTAIGGVITADADTEVEMTHTGLALETPEDEDDTSYGYTSYGAFVRYDEPSSNPETLVIEYPESQINPKVFVTAGVVTTTTESGELPGLVTVDVGSAIKDTELADWKATNVIVIGGPCINSVAAELMGFSYPTCGAESGFEEGKAKIKLVEGDENVALLVAGYAEMDTRRACTVLKNYLDYQGEDGTLVGTEVELTSTTDEDVVLTPPVVVEPEVVEPVVTE